MQVSDQTSNCANSAVFDDAMKLVGDFWTLRIVDAMREGELRFCEMERAIPDISPATLTTRLKKLEEQEVVSRQVETVDRQSVTYSLSERGQGLLPVLDAIKQFTTEHLA